MKKILFALLISLTFSSVCNATNVIINKKKYNDIDVISKFNCPVIIEKKYVI